MDDYIGYLTANSGGGVNLESKSVTVTENGSSTISPSSGYDGISSVSLTVDVPSSGVSENTVNFIDYDGTLVTSYTGDEVQALTDLPSAPDHTQDTPSLTFDGWNWTLAEIKSYNTSYPKATIWVGANYYTTDGKTHLFFRITAPKDETNVVVEIDRYSAGTIDWGDGTIESSSSGTDLTHKYASAGVFHCVIDCNSSKILIDGNGNHASSSKLYKVFLSNKITEYRFRYCYALETISIPNVGNSSLTSPFSTNYSIRAVVLPHNTTVIYDSTFSYCYSLRSVSLPVTITSIRYGAFLECCSLQSITIPNNINKLDQSVFQNCRSLKDITIPDSVISLTYGAFYGCVALDAITIPDGVTQIPDNTFNSCNSLQSIIIPANVTSINTGFTNCASLYSVTVLATTPPELSSSAVFNTLYQKKIYVPAESVATYKAATNWSNFTSIIEAIPS